MLEERGQIIYSYLISLIVPGGGAVEAELSLRLGQRAKEIGGVDGYCLQVNILCTISSD